MLTTISPSSLAKAALLTWVFQPGAAVADPYCARTPAEMTALPAVLEGEWQGPPMHAMVVMDGQLQRIPAPDMRTAIRIEPGPGGIRLLDASMPDAPVLTATTGAADFALPGESLLGPAELLGPLLQGVTCGVEDLPQFAGHVPSVKGVTARFRVYVLSDRDVMLVSLAQEAAEPATIGGRAVLRYRR